MNVGNSTKAFRYRIRLRFKKKKFQGFFQTIFSILSPQPRQYWAAIGGSIGVNVHSDYVENVKYLCKPPDVGEGWVAVEWVMKKTKYFLNILVCL